MDEQCKDIQRMASTYQEKYQQFGYSPKSLMWTKGKQNIRFNVLTSQYDFTGKAVLDIGCGFGDLNHVLSKYKNYTYFGIDIVGEFIEKAKILFTDEHIYFERAGFLEKEFTRKFDYVIASGICNYMFEDIDNYEYIAKVIDKAFSLCIDGIAMDFLSDKVDYRLEETFHSSPEKILSMAYQHSRNVVLRNDYMPFEFACFIHKNDSFAVENTVFYHYMLKENLI